MKYEFQRLEELSSKQLNELNRDKTIFFVTVSPIENHGEHLPLGMDMLEGEAVSKGVAMKFQEERPDWNVIVCPVVPMGNGLMPGIGTIDIRQNVVRDYLIDYLSSLAKKGFKYAFVSGFHGGPRHLVAVDQAVHHVNKKYKTTITAPFGYCISYVKSNRMKLPNHELQNLFDKHRGDLHGGMLETSFMLHLRPDLVKGHKQLEEIDIAQKGLIKKAKALKNGIKSGYLGHPAKANEDIGKMFLNDCVEVCYDILLKCMESRTYPDTIKTLDSSRPYMKTNFIKNVLTAFFGIATAGLITYLLLNKNKNNE